MPHWSQAWSEIEGRVSAPPRLLVACDFDGTLSALASDPAEVSPLAPALDVLRLLLGTPGVSVAVLTGRALADIAPRLPFPDLILAGNHGLEIRGLGLDGERAQAAALKPRLRLLETRLRSRLHGIPGLLVEDKGLSLTVHYRNVPEEEHGFILHEVRRVQALDPGFKLQTGRMVHELLPDIGWDKGRALKQMAARMGLPGCAVFYAGDDTTDETVFRAFPNGLTFHVGGERESAARWMARDPLDVCLLLQSLARARDRRGQPGITVL